jgi:hypothetical protein
MIDDDDDDDDDDEKISGRGNKVLKENQIQCRCVRRLPTATTRGRNPGCRGGKPAISRLSYGTARLSLCCSLYSYAAILEPLW